MHGRTDSWMDGVEMKDDRSRLSLNKFRVLAVPGGLIGSRFPRLLYL